MFVDFTRGKRRHCLISGVISAISGPASAMIVGMDARAQNPTGAGFIRRCSDTHRADGIVQTVERTLNRKRRKIGTNSSADKLGGRSNRLARNRLFYPVLAKVLMS